MLTQCADSLATRGLYAALQRNNEIAYINAEEQFSYSIVCRTSSVNSSNAGITTRSRIYCVLRSKNQHLTVVAANSTVHNDLANVERIAYLASDVRVLELI